MNIEP